MGSSRRGSGSASRGSWSGKICGFPGIYGNPRFLAPSDGPTTVVVCSITISSVVMTVALTVGVVVTVKLNAGMF